MKKKKILLLGSYGRGNIGDDALLLAIIDLLKDAEVTINSASDNLLPVEIKNKNISVIPTSGPGSLWKQLKTICTANIVAYGGGDLWVELYGDRFPRLSLWKMLVVNLLARCLGKKVVYIGCGAGLLKGFSLSLAKCSARLAHHIIAREQFTVDLLGIKEKSHVLPDATINFPITNYLKTNTKDETFVIGISILYHLPDPKNTFPKLVESINQVIGAFDGKKEIRFNLIPFYRNEDHQFDDVWALRQLCQTTQSHNLSVSENQPFSDVLNRLAECDLVIGTRLHANILSTTLGIPCVGISYRPKVKNFFLSQGLDKYVVDLDEIHNLKVKVLACIDEYQVMLGKFKEVQERLAASRESYEKIVRDITKI